MGWFRKILLSLSGESRFCTIQQLYDATTSELSLVNPQNGEWPGHEGYTRLVSDSVSIFYLKTKRLDGKKVETIDIHALAHRGGAWITFVDDKVIALTHNMIKKNIAEIGPEQSQILWQILLKVRHAAIV